MENRDCFRMPILAKINSQSDDAFMGLTHALSGLAVSLAALAFLPTLLADKVQTPWFSIVLVLVVCGGSLIPDLDNTNSRAKSDLGILGAGLSVIFRSSSMFLQSTVRTRYDDPTPNPHRGFWHTPLAAMLTGFLLMQAASIKGEVTLFGRTLTYGVLIMVVVATMMTHLAYSSLLKRGFDKIKKSYAGAGEVLAVIISLGTVLTCLHMCTPSELSHFYMIGQAVGVGMLIHSIGDAFTVWGSPLSFVWSYIAHKRVWWCVSFLPIKAGGAVENYVFIPLFAIVSIVSSVYLALH